MSRIGVHPDPDEVAVVAKAVRVRLPFVAEAFVGLRASPDILVSASIKHFFLPLSLMPRTSEVECLSLAYLFDAPVTNRQIKLECLSLKRLS